MNYIPQVGDVGVTGHLVAVTQYSTGIVQADAVPSVAGTQWAGDTVNGNPLIFEFVDGPIPVETLPNTRVQFDIAAGEFGPIAQNVWLLCA